MKTVKKWDVYSYGMVAASTLHILANRFPTEEGYAEIDRSFPMIGGEAANSSIVLSRLGYRVCLEGSWLGAGRGEEQIRGILQQHRIEQEHLLARKGYKGAQEIVFSGRDNRTIFGNYVRVLTTSRQWARPRKASLLAARVANLDPFFGSESRLAAEWAVRADIPYVTVDCPPDSYLAVHAHVNVISGEYLAREYRGQAPQRVFPRYQDRAKGLVVFTGGANDILFGRRGEPHRLARPCPIEPVDTTGAGDAFRAGMVAGLLQGWPDAQSVKFAAAVSALVCLRLPGVLHSPTRSQVLAFLRHPSRPTK